MINVLRQLIADNCLLVADEPIYVLSNGDKSRYYFDCKRATLNGQCLSLITELILQEIDKLPEQPISIGGLTMGADFIVASTIAKAFEQDRSTVLGSIVRKESKKHGTKNRIENELAAGTKIVVVDDVITTGNSTETACQEFLSAGYEIVGIIALVDRKAGGREKLEKKYKVVRSLFCSDDFIDPIIEVIQ